MNEKITEGYDDVGQDEEIRNVPTGARGIQGKKAKDAPIYHPKNLGIKGTTADVYVDPKKEKD